MLIFTNWTNIKNLIDLKQLRLQYIEDDDKYTIIIESDYALQLYTEIWKDITKAEGVDPNQNEIDKLDFEANYKSNANEKYLKPSYYSELISISKGGINKISVKPSVLIENMCTDLNSIVTLGSGGIIKIGQIFRLTDGIDNINRILLSLEANAGSAISPIDNFESYADTNALRTVWISNDITNTPNTLETSIIKEGIKAMKINVSGSVKSKADEIKKTYTSAQNWTNYTGIQFWYRQDENYIVEIHIIDTYGNGSKHAISVTQLSNYEFVTLRFNNFIPIGAIPVDLSTISSIKIYLKTSGTLPLYVDNIELFSQAAYGTANLELYDFGTNPNPVPGSSPRILLSGIPGGANPRGCRRGP